MLVLISRVACTGVVVLSLVLTQIVKKLRMDPGMTMVVGRGVPFFAVAAAKTLNVFLMRQKEITFVPL